MQHPVLAEVGFIDLLICVHKGLNCCLIYQISSTIERRKFVLGPKKKKRKKWVSDCLALHIIEESDGWCLFVSQTWEHKGAETNSLHDRYSTSVCQTVFFFPNCYCYYQRAILQHKYPAEVFNWNLAYHNVAYTSLYRIALANFIMLKEH